MFTKDTNKRMKINTERGRRHWQYGYWQRAVLRLHKELSYAKQLNEKWAKGLIGTSQKRISKQPMNIWKVLLTNHQGNKNSNFYTCDNTHQMANMMGKTKSEGRCGDRNPSTQLTGGKGEYNLFGKWFGFG